MQNSLQIRLYYLFRTLTSIIDDYFGGYYTKRMTEAQVDFVLGTLKHFVLAFITSNSISLRLLLRRSSRESMTIVAILCFSSNSRALLLPCRAMRPYRGGWIGCGLGSSTSKASSTYSWQPRFRKLARAPQGQCSSRSFQQCHGSMATLHWSTGTYKCYDEC